MSTRGPLDRQPSEPGWWLASDGWWYPPESASSPPPWAWPGTGIGGPRPRRRWVIPVIAAVVLAFGGCGAAVVVALRNHTVRETITALREGADRFYTVDNGGMVPSIHAGDRLAATSRIGIVERGDVLVVKPDRRGVALAIRRVVGLPGESIESRGGRVLIDGRELAEPYLPAGTVTAGIPRQRIPADSYFLLGDSRTTALDSRAYGSVARDSVVSVVLRVLTPTSRAGPVPGSPRR
jgi:signal peptidase I